MVCTKCPPTTVQSCCGLRNLKAASLIIGCLKAAMFLGAIIWLISMLSGNKNLNKYMLVPQQFPTGILVLALLIAIGLLSLQVLLIVGVLKKRRMYVIIYWIVNWLWIVGAVLSLFKGPPGPLQWISTFCFSVADIYFQIVIRSYYLEMVAAAAAAQPEAPKDPRVYTVSSRY